jgi:hypothetical protein
MLNQFYPAGLELRRTLERKMSALFKVAAADESFGDFDQAVNVALWRCFTELLR